MEKGRGPNENWLEYSIFELFSNRKWHGLGPMARGPAPGWLVHGSTMDSTVADGRGSSELGLAATPDHGGLP
jgi:hypothetical protein